jgi:membrane protease YdiL (CAAX protease family)
VYSNMPIGQLAAFSVVFLVLGHGWGWAAQRSGSLWGAVVSHACADFIFFLSTFAANNGLVG